MLHISNRDNPWVLEAGLSDLVNQDEASHTEIVKCRYGPHRIVTLFGRWMFIVIYTTMGVPVGQWTCSGTTVGFSLTRATLDDVLHNAIPSHR